MHVAINIAPRLDHVKAPYCLQTVAEQKHRRTGDLYRLQSCPGHHKQPAHRQARRQVTGRYSAPMTTHTHAQHEVNTICFCATDDDDVSHDDPGTQRRELRNKQAREHSTGSTG